MKDILSLGFGTCDGVRCDLVLDLGVSPSQIETLSKIGGFISFGTKLSKKNHEFVIHYKWSLPGAFSRTSNILNLYNGEEPVTKYQVYHFNDGALYVLVL